MYGIVAFLLLFQDLLQIVIFYKQSFLLLRVDSLVSNMTPSAEFDFYWHFLSLTEKQGLRVFIFWLMVNACSLLVELAY